MKDHKIRWNNPPNKCLLKDNEVHIWRASLNLQLQEVNKLRNTLSSEEMVKASRFKSYEDRDRFIVSKGILRTILGSYLNTNPTRLEFEYNEHGKPFIKNTLDTNNIHFNASHSRNIALYALTIKREIGIDVEYLRSKIEFERIARRFFSEKEFSMLISQPSESRLELFFDCWTLKEAYIKAVGGGLSIPLNRFEVTLKPGGTPKILEINGSHVEASHWSLYSLSPAPNYRGALAVKGHNLIIKYLNWNESLLNAEI